MRIEKSYDKWETFAFDVSKAAFQFAREQARKEADDNIDLMREYINAFVEYEEKIKSKISIVYTPIEPKDMR